MLKNTMTWVVSFKQPPLFKVNDPSSSSTPTNECKNKCILGIDELIRTNIHETLRLKNVQPGQTNQFRYPTTSFLTATTLIYTNGAGITAAAGTRLALHWILAKMFTLFSFRLPKLKSLGIVTACHYLLVSGLDNLRACCLPWMW